METATFAGGCFWCTEAIFKRLKGVIAVTSGYAGGQTQEPDYNQVTTGQTNHAETIQIKFDPSVIPYEKLLEVFFATHDPTTLNRQGNDIGTQYRSLIFYHDDHQKDIAEKVIAGLAKSGRYTNQIVTETVPYITFYPAEDHHQNFYENNPNNPYCQAIIDPKIKKLLANHQTIIKPQYLT